MQKAFYTCFILFFLSPFFLIAQNTVGLLSYVPSKAFDGYNLIYPHNQPNVYLLDNCGEIVHVWEDDASFRPGNTAYLLEDGRLVKTKRPAAIAGDAIWAGGGGATVEIRSWDNDLLWSFTMNNDSMRLHHDIEVLPDGNILMIAWELKTKQEAIQAGRDTALLPDGELWPDYILEVDPTTDEIVWEWHAWDHLIQDFDQSKGNFGDVAAQPERIDLNWDTSDGADDWMHSNALDYNPDNDQIVLSVPTFHEIWVIDHSTTTAEAAGSSGGLGGRGGDLLYRWGNPAVYRAGDADDQKLFYQHDIHWIRDFIDPFDPNYDKFAVFNNRVGADFSTANVFSSPFDMYEFTYPMDGGVWGPENFDLTLEHPEDPSKIYSTGLSSVQYLPNGNFLITAGRTGYTFELTPDELIVWEYVTPLKGGAPVAQGDTSLTTNSNLTFRVKRYPADYSAFAGKDLSQKGWIELDPNTTFCDQILPIYEQRSEYGLKLFPNPADGMVTLEWEGGRYVDIEILDMLGRPIHASMHLSGGRRYLDTSNWPDGLYLVRINQKETAKLLVQHP
jgi:hypothetical protein